MKKPTIGLICCAVLSACGTQPIVPSPLHVTATAAPNSGIPEPVRQSAIPLPPRPAPKVETYSVTVYKVPVQSLLFALARDAKLNVDIHPGITGEVTLNALNQTLPQLLSRISKQIDMRYELDGANLLVMPDTPYLHNYKIDYVNVSRSTTSKVSIATQIATAGAAGGGEGGGNNSTTVVTNISDNNFWKTLIENVKDILRETDKVIPDATSSGAPAATAVPVSVPAPASVAATHSGAAQPAAVAAANEVLAAPHETYREAASVIANPETGLLSVRATGRQHEKIQEFLDMVLSSAKRQVLIEATVIEVQLNDQYQQGINWASLRTNPTKGLSLGQGQIGNLSSGVSPGATPGMLLLSYLNPESRIGGLGNISATVQLLESFGKVKVLSSPKISVLNNQTALLKVVDNIVYFTITATTELATPTSPRITTYTSDRQAVPVGFVMSVTPQISDSDEVTINVRPSISRVVGYVQDPNPALANAVVPVVSNVPVIQTREMESVLKVASGQIAVMGGLMQDSIDNRKDSVPGMGKIPFFGNLFSYKNESSNKTELVIFMRPVVIKSADTNGDYRNFRSMLPDGRPLNESPYGENKSNTEAHMFKESAP